MKKQSLLEKIIIGAAILSSSTVFAGTATDNLDISLTVQAACTVLSVTDVTEVVATGFTGTHSTSGNVNVTCNNGHTYKIGMGAGTHASGVQRNVANGAATIPYEITKSSNSSPWGTSGIVADSSYNTDGTGTYYGTQSGTGTGGSQSFGYGIAFTLAGSEAAGTYTDTILVTLEF